MKKLLFSFAIIGALVVGVPALAATNDHSDEIMSIRAQLEQIKAQVIELVKNTSRVMVPSFTGPLLLGIGESGAWSINVIGDLAGKTHYAVTWGDEIARTEEFVNVTADAATASQQQGDFRHTYRAPGNYTVNFTITTSKGAVARASLPVNVRAQGTVSSGALTMSHVGGTVSQ
jgi:hypothetical protein